MDVQPVVDGSQMKADGVNADAELSGSRFVLMPLGQQLQRTRLLGREGGPIGCSGGRVLRNSSSTRIATSGDITAPPEAIWDIAARSLAGGVVGSRYPRAPAQTA